jgi:hypothetical protein
VGRLESGWREVAEMRIMVVSRISGAVKCMARRWKVLVKTVATNKKLISYIVGDTFFCVLMNWELIMLSPN